MEYPLISQSVAVYGNQSANGVDNGVQRSGPIREEHQPAHSDEGEYHSLAGCGCGVYVSALS